MWIDREGNLYGIGRCRAGDRPATAAEVRELHLALGAAVTSFAEPTRQGVVTYASNIVNTTSNTFRVANQQAVAGVITQPLGTAIIDTGTSGTKVALTSGANVWGAQQTFAGTSATAMQTISRSGDTTWKSYEGVNVNGTTIGHFQSMSGAWSVSGATFSCTKDYDGTFPATAIFAYNQFNGTSKAGIKGLSKAAGATTTDGAVAELFTAELGNFVPGALAVVATNATDGFFYIPACAGKPSGTPTAYTGKVPLIWDTTNKKLYVYDGGWLGGTTPGAFV